MRIAIVDADLISRKKHRFPNLACLKISGYHKEICDSVVLVTDWDTLTPSEQVSLFDRNPIDDFDRVYISKVFTDTPVPEWVTECNDDRVQIGGTGFFFDKAPNLPDEIEHHMPDYHLYDDFIQDQIDKGIPRNQFKEYLDYSIGFLTRGCFRKCGFCVNQKYDHVFCHSPLEEFYDPSRKKICLLDDNFLGQPKWKEMLQQLIDTGKPFKFKQGLDERLLTREKCEMLFNAKYDKEITFAFDRIEDYDLIQSKLELIRSVTNKDVKFYVLVGFDKTGRYDDEFWRQDIEDMFRRLELLGRYHVIPYIMRYEKYKDSPYYGTYVTVARWVNQISFFKAEPLNRFIDVSDVGKATKKYRSKLLGDHPEFSEMFDRYFWEGEGEKEVNDERENR